MSLNHHSLILERIQKNYIHPHKMVLSHPFHKQRTLEL